MWPHPLHTLFFFNRSHTSAVAVSLAWVHDYGAQSVSIKAHSHLWFEQAYDGALRSLDGSFVLEWTLKRLFRNRFHIEPSAKGTK
jgi:hypothetical protein